MCETTFDAFDGDGDGVPDMIDSKDTDGDGVGEVIANDLSYGLQEGDKDWDREYNADATSNPVESIPIVQDSSITRMKLCKTTL